LAVETHRKWTGEHKRKMDVRISDLVQRSELAVMILDNFLQTVHLLHALCVFQKEFFEAIGHDVQLDLAHK
jgi:hypothetical protein